MMEKFSQKILNPSIHVRKLVEYRLHSSTYLLFALLVSDFLIDLCQSVYSMFGQNNHLKNSKIRKHSLQEKGTQFVIE